MTGIDPIADQQQRQYFTGEAVKNAGKAQQTKTPRPKAVVIIVCVILALALLALLFLSGAFSPREKVYLNGKAYRFRTDNVMNFQDIPENCREVGTLYYSETPQNCTEPYASSWIQSPVPVYADPENPSVLYLVRNSNFVCRAK